MTLPEVRASDASEVRALVALIHEQSAAEVAQLVAQRDARVQRLTAAADTEVESIRAAAQREGEERGRRQAAKLLATAEAQGSRQELCDREALLQEVLRRARQQLEGFVALPDAPQILFDFIQEGLQVLPAGPIRLRWPESYASLLDDERAAALAAGGWTLRFETDAVPGGGVILESDDGRLQFDNSFGARMQRQMNRLRRTVADVLFAQGKQATG